MISISDRIVGLLGQVIAIISNKLCVEIEKISINRKKNGKL
jgi:hypothetical protein